jgi:hypothetical protein
MLLECLLGVWLQSIVVLLSVSQVETRRFAARGLASQGDLPVTAGVIGL